MTLLEICFSLLIIAVVFGVAIPFSQEIFRQHPLEAQLDAFDALVLQAIDESQSEQQTASIVFNQSSIRLVNNAEETDAAEADTAVKSTEILIPGGAKYQIQQWPEFEWVTPDEARWDIPATGLILPLNIKWTLDDSWLAASIDPMTGEIKDVTYELH